MDGKIILVLLVVAVAAALAIGLVVLGPRSTSEPAQVGLGELLQSQRPRETSPNVTEAELQELVNGNTAFALELYRALRGREGNLFLSPYSISLALAMAYAGARGETERQMAAVLHFELPQERLHPLINALDLELTGRAEAEGIRLNIANALWGQVGHPFLPEYLDLLAENYGAGLRLVDFQSTPEAGRLRINRWVSDQTEGKIEDLLPPGSITPLTALVLANAIYFKGTWRYEFDPRLTHEGPFHLLDGTEVAVPLMGMEEGARLNYAEGEGYQAVELPYAGEELSMVILLPELKRFGEFEHSLDAARLTDILEGLHPRLVDLKMPKFSFESGFSLRETLAGMGMPAAFSSEADFSGMDGTRDLRIDLVEHKAFILVDERGTEAAAATAVTMERSIAAPPIEVRVDRPFIFLIRDRGTGAILFLGRVLNPAAGA